MNKKLIKSLVFNQSILYIVAGAAIALGTYFLLSASAARKIQANFTPASKTTYSAGESVKFNLSNFGSENVRLSNSAPWDIRDSAGRIVYAPVSLQEIRRLEPNDTISWSWNQRGSNNRRVGPGTYKITIKYRLYGRNLSSVLPFRIVGSSSR